MSDYTDGWNDGLIIGIAGTLSTKSSALSNAVEGVRIFNCEGESENKDGFIVQGITITSGDEYIPINRVLGDIKTILLNDSRVNIISDNDPGDENPTIARVIKYNLTGIHPSSNYFRLTAKFNYLNSYYYFETALIYNNGSIEEEISNYNTVPSGYYSLVVGNTYDAYFMYSDRLHLFRMQYGLNSFGDLGISQPFLSVKLAGTRSNWIDYCQGQTTRESVIRHANNGDLDFWSCSGMAEAPFFHSGGNPYYGYDILTGVLRLENDYFAGYIQKFYPLIYTFSRLALGYTPLEDFVIIKEKYTGKRYFLTTNFVTPRLFLTPNYYTLAFELDD